ncbi:LOW QUALITY PROTEIN: hypothetical protein N665_0295s0001 [Sinapis alba]|nr:LOW QUALITY PROTEIN: hypothetical protein N665_0295s0001 [Sinapis alba]
MKEKGTRRRLGNSPKVLQCLECKGFGHLHAECANLQKLKKKTLTKSNYDDGEELKSIVAFITFKYGSETKSAVGFSPASVSESSCERDDDDESDDDDGIFDLAENYEKLYENWIKHVEKEEEARHASSQLAETQKELRILNNGMKQLDHLPNIGKKKASNGKTAVKTATDVKNATATSTATATIPRKVFGLESASQRKFWFVCHHCAYGMKCHGPICYSCGVQWHIRCYCFKSAQGANHGGFGLGNTRFDHYGDGGMGFHPHFGGYRSSY